MDTNDPVVIVGAGHAGAQCAIALRSDGWSGGITIIGDEPSLPYHRPPLSKSYLKAETCLEQMLIRPPNVYEKKEIQVVPGRRVEAIDRDAKEVRMDNGLCQSYSHLILATGSRNLRPPIEGLDSEGVFFLRTAAEADAIRAAANKASRAVIIGGGYVGLEVAASLRATGLNVTILERESRILARITSPEISTFFADMHHEEGVEIHTGVTVSGIRNDDGTLHLQTKEQAVYEADLVIVGTGIAARTGIAEVAGLEVNDGIVVDESCRTGDEAIYAIGDCARQLHPMYGRTVRLESVQNAVDQAKTAAAAITGKPLPPRPLPWFWSDQYDVKLQIAGLANKYDEVILRRHPETGRCLSAWYLDGEQLVCVDAINDTIAYAIGSKLITQGGSVDRAVIANPTSNLKTLLQPV